jgi:hypothetical protein
MAGKWTDMGRDVFDVSHVAGLFDVTPDMVPDVADGCGTGDLLALVPEHTEGVE